MCCLTTGEGFLPVDLFIQSSLQPSGWKDGGGIGDKSFFLWLLWLFRPGFGHVLGLSVLCRDSVIWELPWSMGGELENK